MIINIFDCDKIPCSPSQSIYNSQQTVDINSLNSTKSNRNIVQWGTDKEIVFFLIHHFLIVAILGNCPYCHIKSFTAGLSVHQCGWMYGNAPGTSTTFSQCSHPLLLCLMPTLKQSFNSGRKHTQCPAGVLDSLVFFRKEQSWRCCTAPLAHGWCYRQTEGGEQRQEVRAQTLSSRRGWMSPSVLCCRS